MMTPAMKAFIAEARAGRDLADAFDDYCDRQMVVPIDMFLVEDPDRAPKGWPGQAFQKLERAIAAGSTDEECAASFHDGMREGLIAFRTMRRNERATPAQLIRKLSADDQLRAAKFIGIKTVAHAIVGGEFEPNASPPPIR